MGNGDANMNKIIHSWIWIYIYIYMDMDMYMDIYMDIYTDIYNIYGYIIIIAG